MNPRKQTNLIYGQIPPHAKELEEAILGALMLDINCVFIGMQRLFPEVFYSQANQNIFRAIQKIYDRNDKIDVLTVTEQLRKDENLELSGGVYYIAKLTQNVVSGANIENHISIVAEMYMKRESISLSMELIGNSYDETTDAFDVINKADGGFSKIQERILVGSQKDMSQYVMRVLQAHDKVKETGVLGISTGLKSLDAVISGLVPPDLIIVAARPGQGKTAFALSVTHNASILGNIPCAWFSLEMDGEQLTRRLVSIHSAVSHEKLRKGLTNDTERTQMIESGETIANAPIYIEDKPGITVRDIRTRTNLLKKKVPNLGFIVVDYIQLMNGIDTKGKTRENIVSEISASLKRLARECDIPVIALSQLSRAVEARTDKMPQLSDLRESGGLEQDADEVLFLMRPEYYGMMNSVTIGNFEYDPQGLCIGKIAKNRHGETKNIAFNFRGETMHFTDHTGGFGSTGFSPVQKNDDNPF